MIPYDYGIFSSIYNGWLPFVSITMLMSFAVLLALYSSSGMPGARKTGSTRHCAR